MPEDSLVEIDEPADFIIIEELLKNRFFKWKKQFPRIKVLCLDVDGVFTKATISVSKEGEFSKEFSYRDGMGLQLIREEGVEVIIMTSENSDIVRKRMHKLGIENVYTGVKDKYSRLEQICSEMALNRNEIAYVGDDINDLSNILSCGLGLCPGDAQDKVIEYADIILHSNGGERAVREVCEYIIKNNTKNS
jgi:N-acylneuraminate cytidylyltransferase